MPWLEHPALKTCCAYSNPTFLGMPSSSLEHEAFPAVWELPPCFIFNASFYLNLRTCSRFCLFDGIKWIGAKIKMCVDEDACWLDVTTKMSVLACVTKGRDAAHVCCRSPKQLSTHQWATLVLVYRTKWQNTFCHCPPEQNNVWYGPSPNRKSFISVSQNITNNLGNCWLDSLVLSHNEPSKVQP